MENPALAIACFELVACPYSLGTLVEWTLEEMRIESGTVEMSPLAGDLK
jgi:hypothetical protein